MKKYSLILLIFILIIPNSIGLKKAYYSENDSRKVPMVHVEGVLGHRVEMPCDITPKRRDDTVYMVLWFREHVGKPFYSFDVRGRGMKTAKTTSMKNGFDRRADFQAGSYPAHLLVSDLQLSDEGVYRCRVDYRYSPTRNALVNLTVVVPPSMPVIYEESGQDVSSVLGPYVEGADVRLTCRVHGGKPEPLVSWYLNGALEDATFHSDRYGNVINELVFRGLNRSHLNSQFTCKASNTRLIQPVEKSVVLDLNLRPLYVKVKNKPTTERLQAGKENRLLCETAGSKPPAILKWFVGGKEITQVNTQDMDAGNVTQATFLFIPQPKDNGARISCRAENPWLNRSTLYHHTLLEDSWTINVVYLPEVKLSLGSTLNPFEIKEGTDVYFECRILANPRVTRLAWYFSNEELRHTPSSGIIMSNQSLVLQGISRKSMGNYTCVATNAEGSTTSNEVYLNVQYSPICRTEMGVTVGAAKGESISLPCAVDSTPSATRFEWEFHSSGGDQGAAGSGSMDSSLVPVSGGEVSSGDVSTFLYKPSTDADFGTFLCWASNDVGRQVQPCVFHVVPAVKPHPLENCTIVNQTNTMIQIECSAHRELPPIPDQPLLRIIQGDLLASPGSGDFSDPISYGLFPEHYVMEVWDIKEHTLRNKMSSETPIFVLKGLSPGTLLRLVLYAENSHGRSEPTKIETVVAGDAEKHVLGASTSRTMDLFFLPLTTTALVIGLSLCSVALVLLLVMIFRTRIHHNLLTTPRPSVTNGRTNGNGNNHHVGNTPLLHHPPEKPGSLQIMGNNSGSNSPAPVVNPNTSTLIRSGGGGGGGGGNQMQGKLRERSSIEQETNPDIIPGKNGTMTTSKNNFMNAAGYHHPPVYPNTGTLNSRKGGGNIASSPSATLVTNPNNRTVEYHSSSPLYTNSNNYLPQEQDYYPSPYHQHPPHQYHHSPLPTNDYNTIYIREKLIHDNDIPESCV